MENSKYIACYIFKQVVKRFICWKLSRIHSKVRWSRYCRNSLISDCFQVHQTILSLLLITMVYEKLYFEAYVNSKYLQIILCIFVVYICNIPYLVQVWQICYILIQKNTWELKAYKWTFIWKKFMNWKKETIHQWFYVSVFLSASCSVLTIPCSGLYAVSSNCQKYIQCAHRRIFECTCPAGTR